MNTSQNTSPEVKLPINHFKVNDPDAVMKLNEDGDYVNIEGRKVYLDAIVIRALKIAAFTNMYIKQKKVIEDYEKNLDHLHILLKQEKDKTLRLEKTIEEQQANIVSLVRASDKISANTQTTNVSAGPTGPTGPTTEPKNADVTTSPNGACKDVGKGDGKGEGKDDAYNLSNEVKDAIRCNYSLFDFQEWYQEQIEKGLEFDHSEAIEYCYYFGKFSILMYLIECATPSEKNMRVVRKLCDRSNVVYNAVAGLVRSGKLPVGFIRHGNQ